MQTPQKSHENSLRDDLIYIWALLWRSRMLIIVVTLVAALVSGGIAFTLLPNWYASIANAVPPRRQGSGLEGLTSGLSSALKDFGLAKAGKSTTETYSFSVILNSRRMKDTMIRIFHLHMVYKLDSNEWTDLRKEYDDKVTVSNEPDGNYLITALHTDRYEAARMALKIYELGNVFADEIYQQEARTSLALLERRFSMADSSLVAARDTILKFSRRYKLFSALDQAKAAAVAISDIRVQQYRQELGVELSRALYGDNDPATSVQRDLLRKANEQAARAENQPGLAGNFSIANVGADVALEYMRLYADMEVFTKIKALIIPVIEQNRQDLSRRQPSLILLDPPLPADKKDRPKRSLIVAGAALAAMALAMAFVILRDRYSAVKGSYKAAMENALQNRASGGNFPKGGE